MVLQALKRSSGGRNSAADTSASPRPTLQNSRITAFFTPRASQGVKSEPSIPSIIASDIPAVPTNGLRRQSHFPTSHASEEITASKSDSAPQESGHHNGVQPSENGHTTSQSTSERQDTRRNRSGIAPSARVKPQPDEQRSLRSKEKAPFKSELATYFSNYSAIITGAELETPFITDDEPILVLDVPAKAVKTTSAAQVTANAVPSQTRDTEAGLDSEYVQPAFNHRDAKTILLSPTKPIDTNVDPLSDDVYLAHHRRAERKEKQLRNIEKERAQHEKQHLERLLDGLRGPDWLRVLGVSGAADGEGKDWKPQRDYFIREISELVDKFARWRDEERRLRLRKERERDQESTASRESSTSVGANSSDLDASAARQLLQEAGQLNRQPRRRKAVNARVLYEAPPSPEQPFTGFYKDKHLRAQAMGDLRQPRHITAFGVALPRTPMEEFRLYEDWTAHDSRRARDSKRRRIRKEPNAKRVFV